MGDKKRKRKRKANKGKDFRHFYHGDTLFLCLSPNSFKPVIATIFACPQVCPLLLVSGGQTRKINLRGHFSKVPSVCFEYPICPRDEINTSSPLFVPFGYSCPGTILSPTSLKSTNSDDFRLSPSVCFGDKLPNVRFVPTKHP